MNLKENKIITLSLIEEFNPDNEMLSDDEDIVNRLNSIYNTCLVNLARQKRIEKTYTFDDRTETDNENYEEFDLPSDWYMTKDLIVQDPDTNGIKNIQPDYYRVQNKIYINSKIKGTHILRYYAYPKLIKKDEDEEKFKFDIDLDIQYLLPYAVASDVLKSDRSVDYTAYENKYRTELSSLNPQKEDMQVFISDDGINI